MTDVNLRIRVEDTADLQVAQSLADQTSELQLEATTDQPDGDIEPQVEPITAIVIGAGVLAAVKFIADWWEKRRGGLVIDLRPNAKDQIRRNRELPYGYVLIFPPTGGKVNIETHDMPKDAAQQILEAVISGAYKTVEGIAETVQKLLPSAKVSVEPVAA